MNIQISSGFIFGPEADEPLLRGFQTAYDVGCGKAAPSGGRAKMPVGGFAAECGVLKVKETRRTLNIGHTFGRGEL